MNSEFTTQTGQRLCTHPFWTTVIELCLCVNTCYEVYPHRVLCGWIRATQDTKLCTSSYILYSDLLLCLCVTCQQTMVLALHKAWATDEFA